MRVGSLVYATEQGLGILAKSFYDAGVLTDVLVVKHSHYASQHEWYPGSNVVSGRETTRDTTLANSFIKDMDAMLFFETPFYWSLLRTCKERGVRTYLMPMYECMPKKLPCEPDRFICPSLLDLRYFPDRSQFIPVPVDVPWKLREKALTFVHNAGHGGLKGRNGTGQLLDAMKYVKSPIKLILRSQKKLQWGVDDSRIDYRVGTFPASDLYTEGDVFVFPERFNGLSLPLQEAFASGMLVMATDRFPMNTWLPNAPLIPVDHYERNQVSGRMMDFDDAVVHPGAIADMIDRWFDKNITSYSLQGKEWAETNSWEKLKSVYLEALSR